MKTFGLLLNLQDDPAKIESYKEYHLKVWPGVTDRLRAVGIVEMRIFLRDQRLFMYIETTDAFDPAVDWPRIQDDPVSKEWNVVMGDLQERSPEARPDEWWAAMELVFDMSWPQHLPGGQA